MLLIKDGAEQRLLARLYQLKNEKKLTVCCLRLDLTGMAENQEITHAARTLLSHELCVALAHQVGDYDGHIFLCDDNEIYVLAAGLTRKHAQAIEPAVTRYVGDSQKAEDIISFYDIHSQWAELALHVEGKIDRQKKAEEQKRHEEKTVQKKVRRDSILGLSLDEALLRTIDERRTARDTPDILFVEDDAFSRQLLTKALKGDYLMSSAEDGQAAIMLYAVKAPDIVFLDIDLPDITGMDVLGKILQMDPKAYIIMLSGNGSRQNVMQSMGIGAKGFIGKPFTREKLLAYIERCPTFKTKKKGG